MSPFSARRIVAALIAAAGLAAAAPGAAQAVAAEGTTPSARPADVESVDAILAALYDVISGPVGEPRDWDRLRSLFRPEARMVPTGVSPQGQPGIRFLTVEEYIRSSGPMIEQIGFREREVARRTERFGNIVHAFSTYAGYRAGEAEPFLRGINSIQLFHDGDRWWIVSLLWEPERPANPLPERYQRSGAAAGSESLPGTPVTAAGARPPAAPTTVVVVRHAEPGADDPRDPGLSPGGQARARALAEAVEGAGVSAVYTTQFRRTRETGAAAAEALGVPLRVVPVRGPDLEQYTRDLLQRIRLEHPGGTVLVVGHSNTVPGLVEEATGRDAEPIGEAEFDRLYLVTLSLDGARVVRTRYGAPSR